MSYELYREIAEELCVPVDDKLATDVRYELYNSKLVYLRHLREHCFRAVNQSPGNSSFSPSDLGLIQKAMDLTKEYQRATILEALHSSLAKAGRREHDDPAHREPA
jgi:hypothetical protein